MTSFALQLDALIENTSRDDPRMVSLKLINCIFLSLSLSVAGLRFWVRFVMLKAGGLDDLILIVAIVFTIFLSAASIVGEEMGLGNHIWQLSSAGPIEKSRVTMEITKILYGCYLMYPAAITFTKLSIMATYLRIFPPGGLRKIAVSLSITTLAFWVASIFAVVFTCIPVQAAWDNTIEGRCYNTLDFFTIFSSFHILLDVMLCILPIPFIWSLSIPKTQRLILLALFCGGALACISSILRLMHLRRAGDNINVNTVDAIAWSIIEVDTGIICASIAVLRPLCRLVIPPYTSYWAKKNSQTIIPDIPKENKLSELTSAFIHTPEPKNSISEVSTPRALTPAPFTPEELQSSVPISEVLNPTKPILGDPSASKARYFEPTENPLARGISNPIFLTNNSMQQVYSRRKTWNIHESIPMIPSESRTSTLAVPARVHSVFDLNLTDSTQTINLRTEDIAKSKCEHSSTIYRPLQNESSLENSVKNMPRGDKFIFTSENDKRLDEFLSKYSQGESDSEIEKAIIMPLSPSSSASRSRLVQSVHYFSSLQGYPCVDSDKKRRRETAYLSTC